MAETPQFEYANQYKGQQQTKTPEYAYITRDNGQQMEVAYGSQVYNNWMKNNPSAVSLTPKDFSSKWNNQDYGISIPEGSQLQQSISTPVGQFTGKLTNELNDWKTEYDKLFGEYDKLFTGYGDLGNLYAGAQNDLASYMQQLQELKYKQSQGAGTGGGTGGATTNPNHVYNPNPNTSGSTGYTDGQVVRNDALTRYLESIYSGGF